GSMHCCVATDDMLEFLLALLTTATVGVLLLPLLRSRAGATSRFDGVLAIHRDQLAEIERERKSGTLPEADAAAARTEVERRILAAADQAAKVPAATPLSTVHRLLPPALALVIPLLAIGLYLQLGHPGLPSAPFVKGARPASEPQVDVARLVAEARSRA